MNALEYFREVVRKNPDIDIIQVNKAIDFFVAFIQNNGELENHYLKEFLQPDEIITKNLPYKYHEEDFYNYKNYEVKHIKSKKGKIIKSLLIVEHELVTIFPKIEIIRLYNNDYHRQAIKNGVLAYRNKDGKCGLVSKYGEFITPVIYLDITNIENDFFAFKDENKKYGYLNSLGEEIITDMDFVLDAFDNHMCGYHTQTYGHFYNEVKLMKGKYMALYNSYKEMTPIISFSEKIEEIHSFKLAANEMQYGLEVKTYVLKKENKFSFICPELGFKTAYIYDTFSDIYEKDLIIEYKNQKWISNIYKRNIMKNK